MIDRLDVKYATIVLLACIAAIGAVADDHVDALKAVRAEESRRLATINKVKQTAVCIFTDSRVGGGSGVVIDKQGFGLTNYHVVQPMLEDGRRGLGGLSDGKLYRLRVVGVDPGGDVALFKLEGKDAFDAACFGNSDALHVGQSVIAMGNPFLLAEDFTPTATLGAISGLHRYQEDVGNALEYADCIQISASINPGNSGGPLFDLDGNIIGINGRASFKREDMAAGRGRVNVGVGYAITISQIKHFLPALYAGQTCLHGTLGATVSSFKSKLLVDAIQEDSPAKNAGLQVGDVLLSVNEKPVRTANEFNNMITTLPAHWPVHLKLSREEKLYEVDTRLEPLRVKNIAPWQPERQYVRQAVKKAFEPFERERRADGSLNWAFDVVESEDAEDVLSIRGSVDAEGVVHVDDAATCERTIGIDPNEWRNVIRPFAAGIDNLDAWEFVRADDVEGRVVSVFRRLDKNGVSLSFAFDFATNVLLRVTYEVEGSQTSIVWRASLQRFGETCWPADWQRFEKKGGQKVKTHTLKCRRLDRRVIKAEEAQS